MHLKSILLASIVLATPVYSFAWQQANASFVGASSTFSIAEKTQVPGETLKPGNYTIHVVDQMDDRMIVRIDSNSSKDHAVFLGVPHTEIGQGKTSGPLTWSAGPSGGPALRGFEFSPSSTVEFVYPKGEAVDLAKRNAAKVVAVDPESEGKPVLKNMSAEDMHVIHLWMLALTTAGPSDKTPTISAKAYQGEAMPKAPVVARSSEPRATQQTEVASLDRFTAPAANQTKQKPVVSTLPHTASQMPLIAMLALLSLSVAGGIRIVRSLLDPLSS